MTAVMTAMDTLRRKWYVFKNELDYTLCGGYTDLNYEWEIHQEKFFLRMDHMHKKQQFDNWYRAIETIAKINIIDHRYQSIQCDSKEGTAQIEVVSRGIRFKISLENFGERFELIWITPKSETKTVAYYDVKKRVSVVYTTKNKKVLKEAEDLLSGLGTGFSMMLLRQHSQFDLSIV